LPARIAPGDDTQNKLPMDLVEPCYDDEAAGVLFEVGVQGRRAQGYISAALLRQLAGPAEGGPAWVAAYRRHQARIDAAVARRAPCEDWETVMLRLEDLKPAPSRP
jgi:Protein of unknown function (DUF1488)